MGYSLREIQEILDGYYWNDDSSKDCLITNFEIEPRHFQPVKGNCFISISKKRWEAAHKNKQTQWVDGNKRILGHSEKCSLIITEKAIPALKDSIPQLIVKDSYRAISQLAKASRKKMTNPVIGITGSVGKSTTRLLFEHLLKEEHTLVATRGNHNTQAGVPLYGAKLCTNPDFAILEISLNALNNRGNQALNIEPDACIVTAIGEAHLSTLHSTANIARFKARIFEGLKKDGLAIINQDIAAKEFDILYDKAKQRTDRIRTYSMTSSEADLYLKHIASDKYVTSATVCYRGDEYEFQMKLAGKGTIENTLAVLLYLGENGYDLQHFIPKLLHFKSLDRIMELKTLTTADQRSVDILDDSHNASIPAMENALDTFRTRQKFYKGNKILVLGQVADLGENSQQLHDKLLPKILDAGFDYVFGHGKYMRQVIKQIPSSKVGGWFNNAHDLARRIPLYCSDDSLILLKGSVSGSDFRLTSHYLPEQLKQSSRQAISHEPSELAELLDCSFAARLYDEDDKNVYEKGNTQSQTIDGLGPLLLLYSLLEKGLKKGELTLSDWPTNNGSSIHGKPFRKGEPFLYEELLEELYMTQHPSVIFELAYRYFNSRKAAMEQILKLAQSFRLSDAASLNITGRYRVKEQQSYDVNDLFIVGSSMRKKGMEQQLPTIMNPASADVRGIIFGSERKSCLAFLNGFMFCIIGAVSSQQIVENILELYEQAEKKSLIKTGLKG